MLTEKDKKALEGSSETWYRIGLGVLVLMFLVQAHAVYWNLALALSYGEAMGLEFTEILSVWNAEPDLQRNYIGYEVQSLHRLNMAILSFGAAVLFALLAFSMVATRARNKRILCALEQAKGQELDNA